MRRGPPDPSSTLFWAVSGVWYKAPKFGAAKILLGSAKAGWLKMLKNSARNCVFTLSPVAESKSFPARITMLELAVCAVEVRANRRRASIISIVRICHRTKHLIGSNFRYKRAATVDWRPTILQVYLIRIGNSGFHHPASRSDQVGVK